MNILTYWDAKRRAALLLQLVFYVSNPRYVVKPQIDPRRIEDMFFAKAHEARDRELELVNATLENYASAHHCVKCSRHGPRCASDRNAMPLWSRVRWSGILELAFTHYAWLASMSNGSGAVVPANRIDSVNMWRFIKDCGLLTDAMSPGAATIDASHHNLPHICAVLSSSQHVGDSAQASTIVTRPVFVCVLAANAADVEYLLIRSTRFDSDLSLLPDTGADKAPPGVAQASNPVHFRTLIAPEQFVEAVVRLSAVYLSRHSHSLSQSYVAAFPDPPPPTLPATRKSTATVHTPCGVVMCGCWCTPGGECAGFCRLSEALRERVSMLVLAPKATLATFRTAEYLVRASG